MTTLTPNHRGLAYGDGYLQGNGTRGQVVKLVGSDLFAVNTDPLTPSFGLLITDYTSGQMPGIYCGGGIYETDVFEGTILAGEALKVSAAGKLTNGVQAGELVIARAIAVGGGLLKFLLLL